MTFSLQRSSNRDKLSPIDFKRDKIGIPGKVVGIESDHHHPVPLALIHYADGEERYILAPLGLKIGDVIKSGDGAELKPGNALPLKSIPTGTLIHNIELQIGKGGQLVRTAGGSGQLVRKEGKYALIRLPSGKLRQVPGNCLATIGQVAPAGERKIKSGKTHHQKYLPVVSREESAKAAEYFSITEVTPVVPVSLLTPELTVSPSFGPPNTAFKVSISGKPEQRLIVHWEEYSFASGWQFWNKKVTMDSQGKASVTISWSYKGNYNVRAEDEATGVETNQVRVVIR